MRTRQQDQQSKVFYELSALVLNLLLSPPTLIDFSDDAPMVPSEEFGAYPTRVRTRENGGIQQITPAELASLLLGISFALMLSGSVTFFIGFMLMPWVLGLTIVFYVVELVSSLSMIGRSILCCSSTPPSSPRNDCYSPKLL